MTLKEQLNRIKEIGKEIAELSKESKSLRKSLPLDDLPVSRNPRDRLVHFDGELVKITTCRKDDEDDTSKLEDVTVTFEPCQSI